MATKRYDLAQFKFGTKEILVKTFTITDKVTVEKFKPSSSKWSTFAYTTEHELTWELEEVDPKHWKFFDKISLEQDNGSYQPPTVTTFDYDETDGSIAASADFTGIYIEEMSIENSNQPFSVSGIALGKKDQSKDVSSSDL